ncbi:hypothetical protein H4R19_001346 [Coemansia spiralis]|nr:hypothetical protein H4R19_001346 [Coemansia spiralis]
MLFRAHAVRQATSLRRAASGCRAVDPCLGSGSSTAAGGARRGHRSLALTATPPAVWPAARAARLSTATPTAAESPPAHDARGRALGVLAQLVAGADPVAVYRHVYEMRKAGLLQTRDGAPTQRVIEDAEVATGVADLVAQQHCWERCFDCLNLVMEMRPIDGADRPLRKADSNASVDPQVVRAVIAAILSPHRVALPERRDAALTALQMFSDFNLSTADADSLVLSIRIGGFLSDRRRLRVLANAIPNGVLTTRARYELAIAHARCLQSESAVEAIGQLPALSKANRIEASVALCLSYAERALIDEACTELQDLEDNESVWTKDQTMFDKQAVVFHTRLSIVHAMALALIPRLPFTENFHTVASSEFSPRYAPEHSKKVLNLLATTVARMRKTVSREKWQRYDLHTHLFRCECAVYAMAGDTETPGLELSSKYLSKRLHGLQREHARALRQPGAVDSQDAVPCGADYVSVVLRSFLWAITIKPLKSRTGTIRSVQYHLRHAQQIAGFQPSAADLEPALLAALPPSVWTKAHTGNFKDNAQFMLADEFLTNPPLTKPPHEFVRDLLKMADNTNAATAADHRLVPLCVLLAVTQGHANQATKFVDAAFAAPPHGIRPGTLALVRVRDDTFHLQMLQVLSTFRVGADMAVTQLRAQLQPLDKKGPLAERMVAGLLYCCVRARAGAVASDAVALLRTSQENTLPARIIELHLRVCVRSGQLGMALPLFRRLNYDGVATQVAEPTYQLLIDYMADQRESDVGAEHVFDVWLQTMDQRGHASAALVDRWRAVGMGPAARATANMFMPGAQESLAHALERSKVASQPTGSHSSRRFLRNWEFHMVGGLIGAYVTSGQLQRAQDWEQWLLVAIRGQEIVMKPEFVYRLARVMQRHLEHGSWEHVQICLDFYIAIDANFGKGRLARAPYVRCLRPASKSFVTLLSADTHGRLAAQIKGYLKQRSASHLLPLVKTTPA